MKPDTPTNAPDPSTAPDPGAEGGLADVWDQFTSLFDGGWVKAVVGAVVTLAVVGVFMLILSDS